MRISDWSSDVCSSDLQAVGQLQQLLEQLLDVAAADVVALDQRLELLGKIGARAVQAYQPVRSEEHTSELQSLMRISYAVFCLKKKKTRNSKSLISSQNEVSRIATLNENNKTNI